MGKDWALPTAKSPEKGKGWYNSTADDNEPETKLLKDDIEDEDEDSSHASAGSLQAMARSRKVFKSVHIFTSICLKEGTRLLGAHSAM